MLRGIALFILALAVAGYFALRGRFSGASNANNTPLPEAAVVRADVETAVEAAGDILPLVQVDVKSEIGARIDRIFVKEGDKVRQGDPLIGLDATELLTEKSAAETEISIAGLELEQATRNYEMESRLIERKLVTLQKFEDRTTERDIAERKLLRARQKLETVETKLLKTRIAAPLSGTILTLPVVEGQVAIAAASVSSGTLLMSIADLTALKIQCHINQVDVAKLHPGMPFHFTVDSLGDTQMNGVVATIAPTATIVNGIKGFSVALEITDPDPRLRPGMTADARIPTGTASQVLAVPVSAVFSGADTGKVVFVRDALGKPQERPVEVGVSNLDRVEIKSGLAENEVVFLTRPPQSTP
jgi:RND family efflux transporter MFP subunit